MFIFLFILFCFILFYYFESFAFDFPYGLDDEDDMSAGRRYVAQFNVKSSTRDFGPSAAGCNNACPASTSPEISCE